MSRTDCHLAALATCYVAAPKVSALREHIERL